MNDAPIQADPSAIRDHLGIFARLAGDTPCRLVLGGFGQNIDTGAKLDPIAQSFVPADADKMVERVAAINTEPHRNIYMSTAIFRPDLEAGKKGGEADVLGVLAIVQDFDANEMGDAAKEWPIRCPEGATMVLQTSSLPKPSFQVFFIFKQPVSLERAKAMATALDAKTGADSCSKDMSHVWRIAGTHNKPKPSKIAEGRPREPQAVHICVPYHESRLWEPDDLERAIGRCSDFAPVATKKSTKPKVDDEDVVNIERAKTLVGKIKPEHLTAKGVDAATIKLAHDGTSDKPYPSKSEAQWRVSTNFERAKLDRDAHAAILMDPAWWVHQTIDEHGGWRYAVKQVRDAIAEVGDLPEVQLPGGERSHVDCARELGPILRAGGVYNRGGIPAIIDASGSVSAIKGARAISLLERHSRFFIIQAAVSAKPAVKSQKDETGQVVVRAKPAVDAKPAEKVYMNALDRKTADALIATDELINALPPINVVTRCPILLDRDGVLVAVTEYDEPTGIFVNGGEAPPNVPFDEAAKIIASRDEGLLCDFDFHSDEDFAKAVVTLLSPALNLGGMLTGVGTKDRVPMPMLLKDESQAGGGYFVKTLCAIYNEEAPEFVTQRGEGGVGSDRETFETALTRGRPFVCFDNWKGMLAIQSAESAMTEDRVPCRVPGVASVNIDPRRIYFVMTSNGATFTVDMANRAYPIQMKKRPDKLADGTPLPWRTWDGRYLLEHVRANQPFILGCVWSIVRRWYELGKPTYTGPKRHDFDGWERAIVYIATNMLGLSDPLASNRELQRSLSSSSETWVRSAALAVRDANLLGKGLDASAIYQACIDGEVPVPGSRGPEDGHIAVGRKLGPAFRKAEEREEPDGTKVRKIDIGGFEITRLEREEEGHNRRCYFFEEKGAGEKLDDYGKAGLFA